MMLSLSFAMFFQTNAFFTFISLPHHMHIRHRNYDEQKAVVVVPASLPGWVIPYQIEWVV